MLPGVEVAKHQRLEPPLGVGGRVGDLGPVADLDVPARRQRLAQVARHALGEVGAPDHQGHALGIPRQVDRRLTGRVAAADDDHRFARERRGLRAGGVEDARIGHLLERRDLEAAVGRARGEHHRGRLDVWLAGDLEPQPPSARTQPGHLAHDQEGGAEHPCLLISALGELAAADPAREAEVVANQRARARLASDGLALDDQRAQPLRGRIDGGGEAGGPGPDHGEIELPCLAELGRDSECRRELELARVDQGRPVADERDRPCGRRAAGGDEQLAARVAVGIDERMRHPAAGEDALQLVGAG